MRSLNPKSTLESLRKEAKAWLKALRGGDAAARERLAAALPDAPAEPGLRDAQLALAREFGLPGWNALKDALDDLAIARRSRAELAEIVLKSAWQGDASAAQRIMRRLPDLAKESLALAAMAGDLDEVRRRLARDPAAATARTGPHDWEPLLYLAYGRLPGAETHAVGIATLLLDSGADPAARFDDGWGNPFTLLGGAIGEGETDRPPHPRAEELVELFLARGTDAFDTQVMYDTSLNRDDPRWLALMWRHSDPARWREGGRILERSALDYLLGNAVANNHPKRVAWLLEHGADPNALHAYAKQPVHAYAQFKGFGEVAALLERHGATRLDLPPRLAFVAAAARGDAAEVRRLAAADPSYLQDPAALINAAQQDRDDIAALLIELGMPVDLAPHDQKRALHWAAQTGSLKTARLLLEAGADPDRRGSSYQGTPLGFAIHFGQVAMLDVLLPHTRDVFGLARCAGLDRLAEVLREDPSLAAARDPHGKPLLFALPDDEEAAEQVAEFLLAHGVDPRATAPDGTTAAQDAARRGLTEAAELIAEAAGG